MSAGVLAAWNAAAAAFEIPDSDKVRCDTMLKSYLAFVDATAGDIWNQMSLQASVDAQSESSVAHLRFLEFGNDSPLRKHFYDRVRAHAESLNQLSEDRDVFFEMLKLNNGTSKALWTVLSFSALGAEAHLRSRMDVEAATAFVMLFDLARHGLYFAFMNVLIEWSVPSDGQPTRSSELSELWQAYVPDYYAAKGEGRDAALARYIKRVVRDISTPETYEGGACLVPFFVRLSFRTHLPIEADPTEIQLKKLSDFYLSMARMPVSAVFDARIPNMVRDIERLCDANRSIVRGGIQDMDAQIQKADGRKGAAYAELSGVHEDQSACSIPIATYDRVCDTTWLCCTLTLKRSGNQQTDGTTPSLLESLKDVPPQIKSWTAFFRSILANDVYSSNGRAPQVSSAYNEQTKEYTLVISAEQFIKKGEKRALDRKIATRNVRGTLQISDDHDQFFGARGFRCVRERWAFSHKPLQAGRPGVLLPTITLGKMIDLVYNSNDCFRSTFENEKQLLETLLSEIDHMCEYIDDPITSNIFNIQALFVRESTYEIVTELVLPEGIRTATQVVESKLDDANNAANEENQLFEGQNLDDLANNQYFRIVSSYLNKYVAPMYLDRWKRTELLVIDPQYYEWNLRTSKYKEEGRESSLYLNKALTNMVALNNSTSLESAVSPASANATLAECIGELRTVYTGIKAALSILAPLVTVLDRQQKIQSKSARAGRRTTVSDVTDLRRRVLLLFRSVLKISESLSKQHLRVCDACESLHGRLESSIPEGMLIHRIHNTLETVKTMLTDEGVLNVLQSIKAVCEALRASGNLGSHATKLARAYDWIPADNIFVFTILDVGEVLTSIDQPVMEWDRAYDSYRELVVGVFLHVALSKEEIVSVSISISKSEGVSVDSSNRRGGQNDEDAMLMEQANVAQNEEQQRQASEEAATVNLEMEWDRLNRLRVDYNGSMVKVVESLRAMTSTITAYREKNRSAGQSLNHTPEENEFLNQDGPESHLSIAVQLGWIERAHTIMTPVPNKSNDIAKLRNKFRSEYATFKIHHQRLTGILCSLVSTVLSLYDNIPVRREALLYETEKEILRFLQFYANTPAAAGGPADDVREAMQTLVNGMRQRRESLQTNPNPLESAREVKRALFGVSRSMDAASDSDAKTAWNSTRGRWESELKVLFETLPPAVDRVMRQSLTEFERLFGDVDDDALDLRFVNMFPAISPLLESCLQGTRRIRQLLSPV